MLSEYDKVKFLAALQKMVEFAKEKELPLTKREIENFFLDIALEEEHYQQIYAYLIANQIQIEDTNFSQKDIQKYQTGDKQKREVLEKEKKYSQYLSTYLQELKLIPDYYDGEEIKLYEGLLNGDENARTRLAEGKLYRVVEIVREYLDDSLITEDLIQEGNMGLLTALSELFGIGNHEDCSGMIDDYIRQAVAFAVDEQVYRKDQEKKILAKINLVHEAAKALAKEMGRIATIQELVEYTKLSIQELEDIINLSEGRIDVGVGDI